MDLLKLLQRNFKKYARKNGADVVHFDGIKDNTLPNQQILFATDKSGIKSLNNRENLPAIYNSGGTTPNYNWKNKPKRVWEGLTGKYYTLPLIGAIGTREGLKND